jgi:hypothetical protein
MTKTQAHAILDRIKNGESVSLAETNAALERTGDLCRASSEPLRFDGNEQRNNRPCQAHDQAAEIGFSYSAYLDCPTTESVT